MSVRIFLASSKELESDRRDFELFLSRRNQLLQEQGVFFDLVIWETSVEAMSKTRLQDEYNKAIRNCDVFVMLFWTKVGKYTKEEFEVAFGEFKRKKKPLVFTYFKNSTDSVPALSRADQQSVEGFKGRLKELGHYCSTYKSSEELQLKLGRQLDRLQLTEEWTGREAASDLSVSVFRHPTWRQAGVGRPVLAYRGEPQERRLNAAPDMAYLRALDSGETVNGIRYWHCPFDWQFPEFDVRILNNSDKTIAIEELVVEVTASTLDDKPVLVVRDGTFNCLELSNEGWGAVLASFLTLEFPGSDLPPLEVPVGDFSETRRIPLELMKRISQTRQSPKRPKRIATAGTLRYETENEGHRSICSFRFTSHVFAGIEPEAAPAPPTARYQVWISAGESPAAVSIPCSQSIANGDMDRFIIAVASERSHRFEFRFLFKMFGGPDLVSDPISCDMFVPRSGQEDFGKGHSSATRLESLAGGGRVATGALSQADSARDWTRIDSNQIIASPSLQLIALNDLNSPSEDVRRAALHVVESCMAPNQLTRQQILALVANEQSLGVFTDALNLLVSGGFAPETVVRALVERMQSDRKGYEAARHGAGLVRSSVERKAGLEPLWCAGAFWSYVGNCDQGDPAMLLALGAMSEDEIYGFTHYEGILLACGLIDEQISAKVLRMLDLARGRIRP